MSIHTGTTFMMLNTISHRSTPAERSSLPPSAEAIPDPSPADEFAAAETPIRFDKVALAELRLARGIYESDDVIDQAVENMLRALVR